MANGLLVSLVAVLGVAPFVLAGQNNVANSGSWSGVIINGGCTVDEAFVEAVKCTETAPGARLALYDDTTRQIYDLEPQTQVVGHLARSVTIRGVLEANTIHVSSLEPLSSIGLAVGQKAFDFSARDQFGQQQTLESLKGSHGTALLFFRSADW